MLTAGAIVLGVGMVFGVLLLVGTIHSTFNQLYDSIYGKTDVVVSGQQSAGALPASTIHARARGARGEGRLRRRRLDLPHVDAHGKSSRAQSAQLFVGGVDLRQPEMSDAKAGQPGASPIEGRNEIRLDEDWAAKHGLAVGDRLRLSTPDRPRHAARVRPVHVPGRAEPRRLRHGVRCRSAMPAGSWTSRGSGMRSTCIAAAGVSAETLRARLAAALGPGVEVATPATKSKESLEQLASLDVVLYFFSGIALFVGMLPDSQLVQHDGAAAHARDRHLARARRRARARRARRS